MLRSLGNVLRDTAKRGLHVEGATKKYASRPNKLAQTHSLQLQALRYVERLQPLTVIWENVQGFGYVEQSADKSPMKMVMDELQAMNYVSQDLDLCSLSFTALVRRRILFATRGPVT